MGAERTQATEVHGNNPAGWSLLQTRKSIWKVLQDVYTFMGVETFVRTGLSASSLDKYVRTNLQLPTKGCTGCSAFQSDLVIRRSPTWQGVSVIRGKSGGLTWATQGASR